MPVLSPGVDREENVLLLIELLMNFSHLFEGPDSSSCRNEISLQAPTPSELKGKRSSSDSTTWMAIASRDAPVVQSDEEEVQVDTALVAIATDTKGPSDVSDESDSQTI